MFPKKMDKVILDAVANPFDWYANRDSDLYSDVDKAFSGFCAGCIARPKDCVLAKDNITASELEAKIYALFDDLKRSPIAVPSPSGGLILDYSMARRWMHGMLYFPLLWTNTARILHSLLTRDIEALDGFQDILSIMFPLDNEAKFGIACSDAFGQTSNMSDVLPIVYARHNSSRLSGDTGEYMLMTCAQWKLPAKERFKGDFHVKTKNPMLVIATLYDPVTPLTSARNVSETFERSVLLQQDSYGHGAISQASLCTAKAVRAYFVDGRLPSPNTVCGTDAVLFSGSSGWNKVFEKLDVDKE
ncbi:hypothetical protein QQZ08_000233 [Neonectria magnoliae]|uniref:Peptidase S33 tripeptidyl aminopeptidase-like C-terminal domain-containing protein n=1 Tax=Neonectria magnoliae TaxID=2732573 RepID=A0ABR1IKA1_9HYPO